MKGIYLASRKHRLPGDNRSMRTIDKIKYRINLRMQLQKADRELLYITKEELEREYKRRNKEK